LLINSVHQYCLQYPAEYDVFFPNESETMLFKHSVLNVSEPSVSIKIQPAGGMTLEQAADQIAQIYAIPGMDPIREPLAIDGEAAIMLDGLSGQDPNRQVVVLHNDYLYRLFFIQMNKNQPDAYAKSETLYRTVIQSFNFRPDSNACPGCPPPEEDPQTTMISRWSIFKHRAAHRGCGGNSWGRSLPIYWPGVWTYPTISQDVISTTVTLAAGEYKGMLNFGWDYQFKP
jgi:hypothetical protein